MSVFVDSDGRIIKEGDILTDFRGVRWRFISLVEDHKVHVERSRDDLSIESRIFFPSVFNLTLDRKDD